MTGSSQLAMRTAGLLLTVLVVGACSSTVAESEADEPIVIEEIDGTTLSRLQLSESAARRLDVQTSTVEARDGRFVVPSAAVIIDPEGVYWVYTNPEPLVFVREQLENVREESQQAIFDAGPAAGTKVVTTAVPELYGAEFGIGK